MKNSGLTSIFRSSLISCALAIGACASPLTALAQTGSTVGTVYVPFLFQIGNQQMPAGLYRIDHEASSLFLFRGPSRSGMVLTYPVASKAAAARGSIAFRRIGSTYFLEGLRSAGEDHEMECYESRAEKGLLQGSKKQADSLTTLALNTSPQR
jgi:hypothetical protein